MPVTRNACVSGKTKSIHGSPVNVGRCPCRDTTVSHRARLSLSVHASVRTDNIDFHHNGHVPYRHPLGP